MVCYYFLQFNFVGEKPLAATWSELGKVCIFDLTIPLKALDDVQVLMDILNIMLGPACASILKVIGTIILNTVGELEFAETSRVYQRQEETKAHIRVQRSSGGRFCFGLVPYRTR